jgi:hypothetical protein
MLSVIMLSISYSECCGTVERPMNPWPHTLRSPASKIRITKRAPVRERHRPIRYVAETNLSAVAALAKLAGSHRRMRRRQKTHPPPFYVNSVGARQHSVHSEDEGVPTSQRSATGSERKFFAFRSCLFCIRCLWFCLADFYLSLDFYGFASQASILR